MCEREPFHWDFLLPYPNQELSCVKDYGKGPARLSPPDVNKHTTAKNTEWKRRLEFATSFTAASMRALAKIASTAPAGLADLLPSEDRNSVMRALLLLREVLVDSSDGKLFHAGVPDARYQL